MKARYFEDKRMKTAYLNMVAIGLVTTGIAIVSQDKCVTYKKLPLIVGACVTGGFIACCIIYTLE